MSKEEFYKYGESLGIKINDLQRLKMLAMADKKYTEEDMMKAFEYGKTLQPFDCFEDFINSLNKQD
jgi:hypothetical protein